MEKLNILLLEDSADDAVLIERMIKKENIPFTCTLVESQQEYRNGLRKFNPDVVISDHTLPQFDSEEALKIFQEYKKEQNPTAAFILVTGTVSEEFAVKIMKKGADDYILKDRLTRLPSAITSALERNRLSEEKKKAEEEKLHLLEILQKSLNEIYIFDSDSLKFKYANEEAKENLGYSLEELFDLTPFDLIESVDGENFRKILESMTQENRGRIFEGYAIRKDQSRYPAQIHVQLIETHSGKHTFLANVLDITEIKIQEQQKELALFIQDTFNQYSDLREGLRIVLEGVCKRKNLPAGEFFAFNFDNTRLKRYGSFGIKSQEENHTGAYLAEFVLKSLKPLLIQDLQQELPEELLQENEFKSAKAFPIGLGKDILAVLVLYSNKEAKKTDNFIHIGEGLRNQLANNLVRKKTEDELAKIFEYCPEILTIASEDGHFKRVNPYFSKLLGYSTEEILKIPFLDLIHPDDLGTLYDWKKNILSNEVSSYQNRMRTKGGDYKWISWSVAPYSEQGLSFAAGKDITEDKKNLEAIELQNKRLAEIAWEQSHVVRAPLARMMGCIQHLEENHSEHSEQLLANIRSSAQELDKIIKTIVGKAEQIKNE